ncbi:MAG: efflux RND transporter periplasmic adaptor subunit [Deltaproteobacteria bacterium]|nr:MAG: efflux RND transporter periplasmic adaptor subunit [Deltaproteobacteria bacterium]
MENNPDNQIVNRPKKKIIRRLLPALFLILLLAVIAILFVRIKSEAELIKARNLAKLKKERPEVNVVTLKLIPSPIRDRLSLPGITQPWIKLQLVAEVSGKVIEKVVNEGMAVIEGDIIAKIDSRDYKNAYQSAKASYELAVADLKRLQKLYKEKVTPQSQLDNATAQVQNAKAAMENAALALERCTIKAPFSGAVNRLFIETGQYLNVADPVAEILQIDRIKVRVGIPESDVDAVRKINDFMVKIDALGGRTFHAKKHFLSRTADPMARLYSLDAVINNVHGEILPDMFARVEIVKKEVRDGIAIPLYSVITRNDEKFVYVVNSNRAHQRKVELGLLEGWRVEVTEGLAPGDQVIVVGHRSVNDGDKVNVVRATENPENILK